MRAGGFSGAQHPPGGSPAPPWHPAQGCRAGGPQRVARSSLEATSPRGDGSGGSRVTWRCCLTKTDRSLGLIRQGPRMIGVMQFGKETLCKANGGGKSPSVPQCYAASGAFRFSQRSKVIFSCSCFPQGAAGDIYDRINIFSPETSVLCSIQHLHICF